MDIPDSYNTQRVHRINLTLIIAIVLVILTPIVINRGLSNTVPLVLSGAAVILLAVINYLLPIRPYLKGLLFAIFPNIVILSIFYFDKFTVNKHYLLFLTIAMIALYFRKELILAFGIYYNVALIVTYLVKAENFYGTYDTTTMFITILSSVNCALLMLYLLSKWGRALIEESYRKEMRAQELLEKLRRTFGAIEKSTVTLESSISEFNRNINSIYNSSRHILDSAEQMAACIEEEASSISEINHKMGNALEKTNATMDISRGVVAISQEMNQKVQEGWAKIVQAAEHINTVNSAIGVTSVTVDELQRSLEKVDTLLEGINQIADQTNMLALNAAIESARAGEHGKGFAVVADEVRKLAEQSAGLTASIAEVTNTLFRKSREAQAKSGEGKAAVDEGQQLLQEVAAYFQEIRDSFEETSAQLSQSMQEIDSITQFFADVQEEIQSVAHISEENAMSTQGIVNVIKSEHELITGINQAIAEISELSRELKALVAEEKEYE